MIKHLYFAFFTILILAACQAQPATTPMPPAETTAIVTQKAAGGSKNKGTPEAISTPAPTGSTMHKSSSDPNASNLIVVKDQFIVNNGLTIDTVTAAQACFIVLYFDKSAQGIHELGKLIVSAPVAAGKTNQLTIHLSQNLNPTINIIGLPGNPVDAVLQTDASMPNSMVRANDKDVMVTFTILKSSGSSIFSTTVP